MPAHAPSRRHISESYVVLPHKDPRYVTSSVQGDAQITLTYDMMTSVVNKKHRALRQPLTAAPSSLEQGQVAKVGGPSLASLASVQKVQFQVPNCGFHILRLWSQIPGFSFTLLILSPRSQVKVPNLGFRPQIQIQCQVLGVVFFWANVTVRGM